MMKLSYQIDYSGTEGKDRVAATPYGVCGWGCGGLVGVISHVISLYLSSNTVIQPSCLQKIIYKIIV